MLSPVFLARQVLLIIDGAIAALMVSGDPEVLTMSERNLQAVLSMRPSGPPAPPHP